jgi:WD40 repeat protein
MDVNVNINSDNAYPKIATGSKDKTVAVAMLDDGAAFVPTWRSEIHTKTVKAVKFRDHHVLATASDDGCVALLDDRMSGEAPPIDLLEGLHDGRPHSVLWDPHNANLFLTAGLDTVISSWDMRYLKEQSPVCEYHGHVPVTTTRCKRIHQPIFYNPSFSMSRTGTKQRFILTGGEGSHALSMFQHSMGEYTSKKATVFSRGTLPQDCNHGDTGSIAIRKDVVAISVEGGEILMLEPTNS